jgi:acetyl-CoA C-acetyltransferase
VSPGEVDYVLMGQVLQAGTGQITARQGAARAEALGVEPLAEIMAHGMCADRFAYPHTVPAIALEKALKKAGRDIGDLGLVEINEAFASVALHATRMLGADETIVNVNGGSVALLLGLPGH